MMPMATLPLQGVRILDLTSVVVGPVCTQRLSDYGAEVIKVEPLEGDMMRVLGGPSPSGQQSGCYMHLNSRKRSIALNLKAPEAAEIVSRLLDECDVFVSNMRPQALMRLGLNAGSLRARRPNLIHCTITGFGPGGPYRGQAAYDSAIQGASGIGGLFHRRDGVPRYVPMLICDHVVGEIAAGSILAALYQNACTGTGAEIEVPMFETMAAFVLQEHLAGASFVPPIGSPGDDRVLNPGSAPLQTSDGWISVTANTDAQVAAFLRCIGRSDALEDPRFATVRDRLANGDDWFALRSNALKSSTTREWLELFQANDVPAMPCHSLETLLEDPHLQAVGMFEQGDHPTEGTVRGIRPSILFEGQMRDASVGGARPIGWDTRSVLAGLGFVQGAIDQLCDSGAVLDPHNDGGSTVANPRGARSGAGSA
jgi:crotonobetainyl-CoA:carnitine CoA-transferase CaiB-like acyl-CoA transferase